MQAQLIPQQEAVRQLQELHTRALAAEADAESRQQALVQATLVHQQQLADQQIRYKRKVSALRQQLKEMTNAAAAVSAASEAAEGESRRQQEDQGDQLERVSALLQAAEVERAQLVQELQQTRVGGLGWAGLGWAGLEGVVMHRLQQTYVLCHHGCK